MVKCLILSCGVFLASTAAAQAIKLTGKVTNAAGQAVSGAIPLKLRLAHHQMVYSGVTEGANLNYLKNDPAVATLRDRHGADLVTRQVEVTLTLASLTGATRILARKDFPPGAHRLLWDAGRLAPGIHFLRIEGGGSRAVRAITAL